MATRVTENYNVSETHADGIINGKTYRSMSRVSTTNYTTSKSSVSRSLGDRIGSNKGSIFRALGSGLAAIATSTMAFFILFLFIRKGLGLPYISLGMIINMYNSRLAILNGGTLTTITSGTSTFSLITLYASIAKYLGWCDDLLFKFNDWLVQNESWVVNVVNILIGPVVFLVTMLNHFIRIIAVIISVANLVINNITALVSTFIDVITFDNTISSTVEGGLPTESSIWSLLTM